MTNFSNIYFLFYLFIFIYNSSKLYYVPKYVGNCWGFYVQVVVVRSIMYGDWGVVNFVRVRVVYFGSVYWVSLVARGVGILGGFYFCILFLMCVYLYIIYIIQDIYVKIYIFVNIIMISIITFHSQIYIIR